MDDRRTGRIRTIFFLTFTAFFLLAGSGMVTGQPATTSCSAAPQKTGEYRVRENDSTEYQLTLVYDQTGLPAYFFRNVFTPVCFTDVCKPVHIDLYWDLLGNYVRFEVPPEEPLTKVDHDEFEDEDYDHLHRILSNTESILKDFSIYELVDHKTYNLSDTVDAVTGATPKTIQNEVIAGAVYTCFTLWHIVNGPVRMEMKEITKGLSDEKLIHHFLQSVNHHYQYWAIDKVIPEGGSPDTGFLGDILQIVEGKNIFTARYALKRIPTELFSPERELQPWIWSVFRRASYPLQMAILEKLETITFSNDLSVAIARQLTNSNEEQFLRMLELLTGQKHLPEEAVSILVQYLEAGDPTRVARVYEALVLMDIRHGETEKKLKQFKKSNRD